MSIRNKTKTNSEFLPGAANVTRVHKYMKCLGFPTYQQNCVELNICEGKTFVDTLAGAFCIDWMHWHNANRIKVIFCVHKMTNTTERSLSN